MKKKVLIIVLVIALIVIVGIISFLYMYFNTSNGISKSELIQKGYEVFGSDYCTGNHDVNGAGDAFTDWECKICGKKNTNPDTNVPEICFDCARITNRCYECGKLEN